MPSLSNSVLVSYDVRVMIDEQAGIDPPLPTPPWQRVPQRPAGRRRDPLTRDAIVQTAIRLLDQEGLDALSMRRLALLARRKQGRATRPDLRPSHRRGRGPRARTPTLAGAAEGGGGRGAGG